MSLDNHLIVRLAAEAQVIVAFGLKLTLPVFLFSLVWCEHVRLLGAGYTTILHRGIHVLRLFREISICDSTLSVPIDKVRRGVFAIVYKLNRLVDLLHGESMLRILPLVLVMVVSQ